MIIVVEYSARQDAIHIGELNSVLDTNLRTSLSKIDIDYRIIGLFKDYESAQKYADSFRGLMKLCKKET